MTVSSMVSMQLPLAIVCYRSVMPGGRVLNRLEDLGYRVRTVDFPADLVAGVREHKPMVVLAELDHQPDAVVEAIRKLAADKQTSHVPVIVFTHGANGVNESSAREAGAAMVVPNAAILNHLEPLLRQALDI